MTIMIKQKHTLMRTIAANKKDTERNYWLNKLSGDLSKTSFPYEPVREKTGIPEGQSRGTVPCLIKGELFERLMKISEGSDLRFFMILAAGLYSLLQKYTGCRDIVIGMPVHSRETQEKLINRVVALRNNVDPETTFRELLADVRQMVVDAVEHQNYPVERLIDQLELHASGGAFPLFDVGILLENIHNKQNIKDVPVSMLFSLQKKQHALEGTLKYNPQRYTAAGVEQVARHFERILLQALTQPGIPLHALDILSPEEKKQLSHEFNLTRTVYPREKTLHQLFDQQVDRTPEQMAVICPEAGDQQGALTYRQLRDQSNRLANYLCREARIRRGECVGILMDRLPDLLVAVLGILKAGGAYVPLDSDFPRERIKGMVDDTGMRVVLFHRKYIKTVNCLQWECPTLETILCMDSKEVHSEKEQEKSALMGKKLWEYVGEKADDDIDGGGWVDSYTGQPFSRQEMDEYGENIVHKLVPLLQPHMRVLEIGCASGISMYRLAPRVAHYHGTDLSSVIIEKNRELVKKKELKNIELSCLPAHDIHKVQTGANPGYQIIILNSVVQCFHGHNYLRGVLSKALDLIDEQGYIFVGDVMDQDLKKDMVSDFQNYKLQHSREQGIKTKTDWSTELFLSRAFFKDLTIDFPAVREVHCSEKKYTIENELTRFRFDVLLRVNKKPKRSDPTWEKYKLQHDLKDLSRFTSHELPVDSQPHDMAYVIYTSGSTGRAKGVMVEHRNVVRLVKNTNYVEFKQGENLMQSGALEFDASTFEVWGALLNGMTLFLTQKETILDPFKLKKQIKENNIHMMWMTSPLFNRMVDAAPDMFRGLKYLLVGGDVVSPEHTRIVKSRFPELTIVNGYGPTENTTFSTTHRLEKEPGEPIPIGMPIANSTAYIVDHHMQLQPLGVAGELLVGGDGVARGYLNNSEFTHTRFIPSPFIEGERLYRTGDRCRRLPHGAIQFLGRMDSQVKIRGFRVEPAEIENILSSHDTVSDCVVIDLQDNTQQKYLCAYIVPRYREEENKTLDNGALEEYLSRLLPDYMIPSHFIPMEKIPLNRNGKIDKRALPTPEIQQDDDYVPPSTQIQCKLVDIWADVLSTPPGSIGIHSNFFELGGHSLKATVVVTKIHEQMDVAVPITEIFQSQTISELASYIETQEEKKYISIATAPEKEYYPLAAAQKRLFILQQMEPESTGYNETTALCLKGTPDRQKLEHTFNQLTARHESLRTAFVIVNGDPMQKIHDAAELKLEYQDLRGTGISREDRINAFVRAFELSCPPLIRLGLFQTGEREFVLVYDMHHIITDGSSMNILISEAMTLYAGVKLSPLKIRYRDYSEWQNSREQQEAIRKQEKYWLRQFEQDVEALNLPLDFPRTAIRSFEGDSITFDIDSRSTRALRLLGLEEETTLYMVLLAIYQVLLFKLSGQDDIVVGTPIANRRHADLHHVIGMFVNTLAIRSHLGGNPEFREFLREIKTQTLESFENQDYPFEDLVDKVDARRDLSRNPLFDTLFALQNMEMLSDELPVSRISDLEITPYTYVNKAAKFDLSLHVNEVDKHLVYTLEYSTQLFTRESMERWIGYYKRILAEVLRSPDKRIASIETISAAEKEQILCNFNNSAADFPHQQTLSRIFQEQVDKQPDAVALCYPEVLTYNRFSQLVDLLAYRLKERGVSPGDVVGISVERSVEVVLGLFAILKAGASYLPISPDYPEARKRFILRDSGASLLLNRHDLTLDSHDISAVPHVTIQTDPTDPAYILYTSGTTGQPKGVLVEHRAAVNLLHALCRSYSSGQADVYLLKTALLFDVSITELFGWFMGGGRLAILEKGGEQDPAKILDTLEAAKVTHINFVPSMFNVFTGALNPQNTHQLSSLKYIFLAGEALQAGMVNRFREHNKEIALENLYGPTETTVYASGYSLSNWRRKGGIPIGKPLQNLSLYVLDFHRHNCLQPPGIAGELCIAGEGLARGYLNRPQLTAETFIAHPFQAGQRLYRSGDLARWTGDGNIEFLGRIDSQVKIRGFRVELLEIENILNAHPQVKAAVLFVEDDSARENYLCAYYVPHQNPSKEPLNSTDLKEYLTAHLPPYMVPSHIIPLDAIPLTPGGKLDRKALPKPQQAHMQAGVDYVAPRTRAEQDIAASWRHVLDLEEIGIHHNFFDIGGASIDLIKLNNILNQQFQRTIPLIAMFQHPTIHSFAAYITNTDEQKSTAPPTNEPDFDNMQDSVEEAVDFFEFSE